MSVTDFRIPETQVRIAVTCADCRTVIDGDLYRFPRPSTWGHVNLCRPCMVKRMPTIVEYPPRRYDCRWCGRCTWYTIEWPRAYCTRECKRFARNARRRQAKTWGVCVTCKRRYQSVRRDSVTCSPACRQKAYRRRNGGAA